MSRSVISRSSTMARFGPREGFAALWSADGYESEGAEALAATRSRRVFRALPER
jgi:hypothetical protein